MSPYLPDQRDRTPEPPAYLDPDSILRNRERTRKLLATGDFTWPRWEDGLHKRGEWVPA